MKYLALTALFLFSTQANASGLACDHTIFGAPFVTVVLEVLPDGALGQTAKVSMLSQGKPHPESVTQEANRPGELYHLWISKDKPDNSIEMMVYQDGENFRSKLINPRFGVGREAQGVCRQVPWE
jgi:hypothetical protein